MGIRMSLQLRDTKGQRTLRDTKGQRTRELSYTFTRIVNQRTECSALSYRRGAAADMTKSPLDLRPGEGSLHLQHPNASKEIHCTTAVAKTSVGPNGSQSSATHARQ